MKAYWMLLLFVPFAFADFSYVNDSTTLWSDAHSDTAFLSVDYANITVYNPSGVIVVDNKAMAGIDTGLFSYNYTPLSVGIYYTYTTYYNSTFAIVGLASGTLSVVENAAQNTTEEFNMLATILQPFILFCVGVLIAWIGKKVGSPLFYVASGLWFAANTVAMAFAGSAISFVMFFALLGIVLIYVGVVRVGELHIEGKRAGKRFNLIDDDADDE